jgi:ABC-type sugar transport system ATPase subunit
MVTPTNATPSGREHRGRTEGDGTMLELRGISKAFAGTQALEDVDLSIRPAEVLGLLGENGAGKSTLVKILAGAHHADSGTITLRGEEIHLSNPRDALRHGISVVHQELKLVPDLDVASNFLLGREPGRLFNQLSNRRQLYADAAALQQRLGLDLPLTAQVGSLSVAQQQLVEIVRALSIDASVLLLDEPTSALSDSDMETLFATVERLRESGVAVVLISHRLDEIFSITDRVAIMRDGRHVKTLPTAETSREEVIRLMVGRDITELFPKTEAEITTPVLQVRGLSSAEGIEDVSFEVRAGEIVGLAGLVGAGRTEVARAIFGADVRTGGEVLLEGKPVAPRSPADGIELGIGLVPENRKLQGLVPDLSIRENLTLASLRKFVRGGLLSQRGERSETRNRIAELDIRPAEPERGIGTLSGGNQQKVIIARWLLCEPKVLILDEPTKGVDVGAKAEIHRIIGQLVAGGVAVIVISSELPELLSVSDRILVMREKRLVAEFPREEATQELIMTAAAG